MIICEKNICTGCAACANICPKKAIDISHNSEGFLFPSVNERCINCGLCKKVCPVNRELAENTVKKSYAACSLNDELVKKSTSGAIFSEVSNYIFSHGGVVFGSRFTKDFKSVEFGYAENETQLPSLRGSKYIQSEVKNAFKEVKRFLQDGRQVLFSGTPCQVAGLYSFLGEDYDNLVTMDLFCYGVASTLVYNKEIDRYYGAENLIDVSFRNKDSDEGIKHKNYVFRLTYKTDEGIITYDQSSKESKFYIGFMNYIIMRKSCQNCKYRKVERVGDISFGDYSNYRSENEKRYVQKGFSTITVNTDKGMHICNEISENLDINEYPLSYFLPFTGALRIVNIDAPKRDLFFECLTNCGYEKALQYISQ